MAEAVCNVLPCR